MDSEEERQKINKRATFKMQSMGFLKNNNKKTLQKSNSTKSLVLSIKNREKKSAVKAERISRSLSNIAIATYAPAISLIPSDSLLNSIMIINSNNNPGLAKNL